MNTYSVGNIYPENQILPLTTDSNIGNKIAGRTLVSVIHIGKESKKAVSGDTNRYVTTFFTLHSQFLYTHPPYLGKFGNFRKLRMNKPKKG